MAGKLKTDNSKLKAMCIQNALQEYILEVTNDGKDVIDFFRATMHGQNPSAKFHHQMEAAKQLRKLGIPTTPFPLTGEGWDGGESSVRPEPVEGHSQEDTPSPSTGEGRDGGENPPHPVHPVKSNPVTDSDIINYDIAHLIREETSDGYFIADFLARVMRGTAGQGRPISESDRLRAGMELMNRGLGRFGDTRDRRISNSQQEELIHSGLSRYIRERTDNGLHAGRFLLDVASGQEQSFSMHQRVVATRELVRRGWDTNYDAITPEDIAAYRERQDALEPTEYDIRLQQWREKERAKQEAQAARDEQLEEEPQLEAGLFAHLSFAEIDRYEAMSAAEQQQFVERQRQLRAARRSAAAHQTTPSPSSQLVIPAEAGIHRAGTGVKVPFVLSRVLGLSKDMKIPLPPRPLSTSFPRSMSSTPIGERESRGAWWGVKTTKTMRVKTPKTSTGTPCSTTSTALHKRPTLSGPNPRPPSAAPSLQSFVVSLSNHPLITNRH